jgi:hypothetical protein
MTSAMNSRVPPLSLDGLPRTCSLRGEERRALRARCREWGYKHREDLKGLILLRVAFIPGAISFLVFLPVIPTTFALRYHIGWAVLVLAVPLVIQYPLTRWFMARAVWPVTCRALAGCGHEVCQRCAFDLRGLESGEPRCPECGCARLSVEPVPPILRPIVHAGPEHS